MPDSAPPPQPANGDRAAENSIPNNLPPRHPKFVGRDAEFDEIHQLVSQNKFVAINQKSSPHPLGGTGKSSMAIAYGWEALSEYPGGVFYVDVSSGFFIAEFAKIGDLFGAAGKANEVRIADAVSERLSRTKRSLLILDGLNSPEAWSEIRQTELLPSGSCRCLITTDCQQLEDAEMYAMGGLTQEDGVQLLSAYRPDALDEENLEIVSELVSWLDGYPVWLTLVGTYMAEYPDESWDDFRSRYSRVHPGRVVERKLGRKAKVANFVPFIHTIFDELIEQALQRPHRLAMEYATPLAGTRIELEWLTSLVPEGKQVVARLLSFQLLRPQAPGCRAMGMPRVLRERMVERFKKGEVLRYELLDDLVAEAKKRAIAVQKTATKSASLAKLTNLRDELTSASEFAKQLARTGYFAQGASVAKRVAPALHSFGQFHEAIALLDSFLNDRVSKQLNPLVVAVLMSNKAASLTAADQAQEARRLMERALQIDQKHLPADHPTLAAHYSNMAGLLKSLGEFPKARRFFEQAIQIEEKHFGKDHPNVGLRHWWLGDIDLAEEKTVEACNRFRLALKIMRKHYPQNHPQVRSLTKLLDRHSKM